MPPKILISAGEASGDLYAAGVVERLLKALPLAEFFGCAGPRMRAAGVRAVVDTSSLSMVGLVEVLRHIPSVYSTYRYFVQVALREKPQLAILTDSPDFHLRVARHLRNAGIPVVYLVAPQVWAWRKWRIHAIRRNVDRLLCIFPFEEEFFRRHGVKADYIGHPLIRIVKPSLSRVEFFNKHGFTQGSPLIALLPGSRRGEIEKHLPVLLDAAEELERQTGAVFVLACPTGASEFPVFTRLLGSQNRQVHLVEGETWDTLAHADLALAASGTVTIEAAILGTPMVTFYKVAEISWRLGRHLVEVPYYSMVNLIAERAVVPELIQNEVTGERLAAEALRLLSSEEERIRMREGLREVTARLSAVTDPMEKAAQIVQLMLN